MKNLLQSTDKDWETFGATDPYFSVITQEQFHKENLDADKINDFFESGQQHVAELMERLPASGLRKRAFDFGCGVGRLAIPLGNYFEEVVGADVSQSMLREANINRDKCGASNVSFVQTSDSLEEVKGHFDLVHTFIVLQHIPVARGNAIFRRLVELVAPGGFGSIQLTYSKNTNRHSLEKEWPPNGPNAASLFSQACRLVRNKLRGAQRRGKQMLLHLRPLDKKHQHGPKMQMNSYTLNPLLHTLQECNVKQISVDLADYDGQYGANLFFQKPSVASSIALAKAV